MKRYISYILMSALAIVAIGGASVEAQQVIERNVPGGGSQEQQAETDAATTSGEEPEVVERNVPDTFTNEQAQDVEPKPDEAVSSEEVEQQREALKQRDRVAPELLQDSDNDGLTDYDEINIYETDPNNPNTGGGPYNDGEDVERGLDPLAAGPAAIQYEDPRDEKAGEVTGQYTVDAVEAETESTPDGETRVTAIEMRGRAQPKSYVTLYVFSTPVVVTVKADSNGEWRYRLDKELPDGEHKVYVASVNNSGKILLKSDPTGFTKSAAAVSLNTPGVAEAANQDTKGFFQENYIYIIAFILVIGLLFAILLSGVALKGRKNEGDRETAMNDGEAASSDTSPADTADPSGEQQPPSDDQTQRPSGL